MDAETSRVTFSYKLAKGMCPKSYGINVARMVGLPEQVVALAAKKSEEFERALWQSAKSEELSFFNFDGVDEPNLDSVRSIRR